MNRRAALRGGALLGVLIVVFVAGVYTDQAYPDVVPYFGHRSVNSVDLTELQQAIRLVQADYVDGSVDTKKLSHGTVQGLISALGDPFSAYLDPDQYKKLQQSYQGRYSGIGIYQFGTDTSTEFSSALSNGLPGAAGIVLDLRGDPGGFISAADDVISQFVSSGETFELRDRSGHVESHKVSGQHAAPSVPLVVLVDANSASASEIVAGALQGQHWAERVGAGTFGKWSGQQEFVRGNGSGIHLKAKRGRAPD